MHGKAVVRGTSRALVVVDMPFGTYEESPSVAFRNAARVMKETQCGAVKLEGGARMAETIRFLSERGIPVMAHIGLTPQSVNVMGGFKTQGRDEDSWASHEEDARAVAEAGAFALVLEGMVEPLAARITKQIAIPTIGIGASAECDGQILVLEDMLGLNPTPPKFVKVYGNLGGQIEAAVKAIRKRSRSVASPVRARFTGRGQFLTSLLVVPDAVKRRSGIGASVPCPLSACPRRAPVALRSRLALMLGRDDDGKVCFPALSDGMKLTPDFRLQ